MDTLNQLVLKKKHLKNYKTQKHETLFWASSWSITNVQHTQPQQTQTQILHESPENWHLTQHSYAHLLIFASLTDSSDG